MARVIKCMVRIPMLPFAVMSELFLFASAMIWAQCNIDKAAAIILATDNLPDIGWYFGKEVD